jgi:hypothetical protein
MLLQIYNLIKISFPRTERRKRAGLASGIIAQERQMEMKTPREEREKEERKSVEAARPSPPRSSCLSPPPVTTPAFRPEQPRTPLPLPIPTRCTTTTSPSPAPPRRRPRRRMPLLGRSLIPQRCTSTSRPARATRCRPPLTSAPSS